MAPLDVAEIELTDLVEARTIRREGLPAREIVRFSRDDDVDEIIVGPAPFGGVSTVGSTTQAVLDKADKPVFVPPARSV